MSTESVVREVLQHLEKKGILLRIRNQLSEPVSEILRSGTLDAPLEQMKKREDFSDDQWLMLSVIFDTLSNLNLSSTLEAFGKDISMGPKMLQREEIISRLGLHDSSGPLLMQLVESQNNRLEHSTSSEKEQAPAVTSVDPAPSESHQEKLSPSHISPPKGTLRKAMAAQYANMDQPVEDPVAVPDVKPLTRGLSALPPLKSALPSLHSVTSTAVPVENSPSTDSKESWSESEVEEQLSLNESVEEDVKSNGSFAKDSATNNADSEKSEGKEETAISKTIAVRSADDDVGPEVSDEENESSMERAAVRRNQGVIMRSSRGWNTKDQSDDDYDFATESSPQKSVVHDEDLDVSLRQDIEDAESYSHRATISKSKDASPGSSQKRTVVESKPAATAFSASNSFAEESATNDILDAMYESSKAWSAPAKAEPAKSSAGPAAALDNQEDPEEVIDEYYEEESLHEDLSVDAEVEQDPKAESKPFFVRKSEPPITKAPSPEAEDDLYDDYDNDFEMEDAEDAEENTAESASFLSRSNNQLEDEERLQQLDRKLAEMEAKDKEGKLVQARRELETADVYSEDEVEEEILEEESLVTDEEDMDMLNTTETSGMAPAKTASKANTVIQKQVASGATSDPDDDGDLSFGGGDNDQSRDFNDFLDDEEEGAANNRGFFASMKHTGSKSIPPKASKSAIKQPSAWQEDDTEDISISGSHVLDGMDNYDVVTKALPPGRKSGW